MRVRETDGGASGLSVRPPPFPEHPGRAGSQEQLDRAEDDCNASQRPDGIVREQRGDENAAEGAATSADEPISANRSLSAPLRAVKHRLTPAIPITANKPIRKHPFKWLFLLFLSPRSLRSLREKWMGYS